MCPVRHPVEERDPGLNINSWIPSWRDDGKMVLFFLISYYNPIMNFHFLTLFPKMIEGYFNEGVLSKAAEKNLITFTTADIRAFAENKHGKVDDSPYGGGPGMVMTAEPILRTAKSVTKTILEKNVDAKILFINLSPRGELFNKTHAQEFSQSYTDIIFLCGRYEGIDYRVMEILQPLQISLGDFVVTGGELPALMITDAVARFIPNVLGNELSEEGTRTASEKFYTKPETFEYEGQSHTVPEVLLSGHHLNIEKWRKEN